MNHHHLAALCLFSMCINLNFYQAVSFSYQNTNCIVQGGHYSWKILECNLTPGKTLGKVKISWKTPGTNKLDVCFSKLR